MSTLLLTPSYRDRLHYGNSGSNLHYLAPKPRQYSLTLNHLFPTDFLFNSHNYCGMSVYPAFVML